MPRGDEHLNCFIERKIEKGETVFRIFFEIIELLRHGEVEKGETVVKKRRKGAGLIGFVVHQQTEVFQVAVGVENQGIKDHHVGESVKISSAKFLEES